MAIETVTNANLAEYAAKRAKPAELTSPEAVTKAVTDKADAKTPTPGNPVITTGEERLEGVAPDPGVQPTAEERKAKKAKGDNPVQARIDELTREKYELDEAFQSEYEQRLRLEGELSAMRSQAAPKEEKPKDELGPQPDPATFTDQKEFLAKYGEWVAKKARLEFAAEQETQRREDAQKQSELAMAKKVAQAMADFEDFQDVIDRADKRTRGVVPAHVIAAMHDSDVGAHIAYHLAKNPDEEKRIFGMSPAKALLELGKIETQYVKKEKAAEPVPAASTPPETKQTPAPIARLKEGSGIVASDLSQPMTFKDYRLARIEQIRASGRRRH